MQEDLRAEMTDGVNLLDSLKDRQKETHSPVYAPTIKKVRRELLGLYTRKLNQRKSIPIPVLETSVEVASV